MCRLMAGGTWSGQNKTLPGVYFNIKSAPSNLGTLGERGTVTICRPLSWGPVGRVIEIAAGENVTDALGYDVNTADEMLFLREVFRGAPGSNIGGASKVLLYRPAGDAAAAATCTMGTTLTAKAAYPGKRGNDISLSITADPDVSGSFVVETQLDGVVKDRQIVSDLDQLTDTPWLHFTGSGTLSPSVSTPLKGGADGTVTAQAYSEYLTAVESYTFDVMVYDGQDETVKAAVSAFVWRMREDEGRKCQAVMGEYPQADHDGVISIGNGLVTSECSLQPNEAAWWVGGCTAGANYNQSLTYAVHPAAKDIEPRMTTTQVGSQIEAGNLVFMSDGGKVKIVTDVNTFRSFTPEKGKAFRKNRVMRVLDAIANDIHSIFSEYYIGKVDNSNDGRNLLKKEIVGHLNTMQANGGVQNFVSDDVIVSAGGDVDAVVIDLAVQPVDAVEKIYMTVSVS